MCVRRRHGAAFRKRSIESTHSRDSSASHNLERSLVAQTEWTVVSDKQGLALSEPKSSMIMSMQTRGI